MLFPTSPELLGGSVDTAATQEPADSVSRPVNPHRASNKTVPAQVLFLHIADIAIQRTVAKAVVTHAVHGIQQLFGHIPNCICCSSMNVDFILKKAGFVFF